jgi:cation:H+ antiporter
VTALLLLAAFVLIVAGAVGFTNAVEWLGSRLNLGQGAVGGLLAAVGTALPESLIPIVALLAGSSKENTEIAIGAVIGAPFLLGTLAMLLVAVSAHSFTKHRDRDSEVHPHEASAKRDLHVFLAVFPLATIIGALDAPDGVRYALAAFLIVVYGVYVWRTAKGGGDAQDEEELKALFFDTSKGDPPNVLQMLLQFVVSLGAIIGGAELFVHEVEAVSKSLGVSILILSLVLAPLATELPEKANSVLWVRQGKDELAVGNITGAMVFQATIPVALLLVLTDWDLSDLAIAAAIVAILGGATALWAVHRRHFGGLPSVIWVSLLVAFTVFAVATA